ncbi:estradiol 17-beta-dehydrogenase 2-like [Mytilus californianus]|uniref:estradiol 17-beta-dehydrogenase 2-like n=1 Tax=Mytilus californianus TaxID=6549 RepID=UPI00224750E8|nr:estradiol 17-beta-dehydrogenase 2-like [Mytilus californianus]
MTVLFDSDNSIKYGMVREIQQRVELKPISMDMMINLSWATTSISIYILYATVLLHWYKSHMIQLRLKDINGLLVLAGLTLCLVKYGLELQGSLVLLLGIVVSYFQLSPVILPINNKAILITGCDRGIGKALAKYLDKAGFKVYAGCLENEGHGKQDLTNSCSSRLQTIQLDVSNEIQIKTAAAIVQKDLEISGMKLWGVINNAGICFIGNVEMMVTEDIHKILAVNYLGPVTVCKHFLPLLRESQGRIVNVASNCGLAPVPLMGPYCASKSALATMSEVWRYEFKMWKIKVCTIIPSGYKTGIMAYDKAAVAERWWKGASKSVKENYGKDCFYIKHKLKDPDAYLNPDFTEILDNINLALLSVSPKSHYYSGLLSRALPFLYLHLPSCIGDRVMSIMVNWFDFVPKALSQQPKSCH